MTAEGEEGPARLIVNPGRVAPPAKVTGRVNARRFVRKMKMGSSQPHLLEGDDGNFYVTKFLNNPQHRRILVNEFLSAEIMNYLQIPTARHQIISVSAEFLAANPDVYIQAGQRRSEVEPGYHLGLQHPGNPKRMDAYDLLPDVLLNQLVNLNQFIAVHAFDRWVVNRDVRESIFFRVPLTEKWIPPPGIPQGLHGFVVLMIDHGSTFNGSHWTLPDELISIPWFSLFRLVLLGHKIRIRIPD